MNAIRFLLLFCVMTASAAAASEDTLHVAPDLPAGLVAELPDDELLAAAEAIEEEVREEGPQALVRRMHTGAFLHRVQRGRDFDEELQRELRVHWSYDELMEDFFEAIDGRGALDFRELVWHDGQRRARFRLIGDDLSFNYHDLLLVRNQWGDYQVADYAPMSAGVDMSSVVGEMMESIVTLENLVGEFEEAEDALSEIHLLEDPVHRFLIAFQALDPAATWEHFPTALEARPSDALFLFGIMLKMAVHVGEEVANTVETMALDAFPDHPTVLLNQLDVRAFVGDFDVVIAIAEALERIVGADGMLTAMRGIGLVESGQVEEGRALVAEATRTDGHVEILVVLDLGLSMLQEDFARTIEIFEYLESNFGYDIQPDALAENPMAATLLTSEPYQAWLARRSAGEESAQPTDE